MKITEFEIVRHGIDNCQRFPGCPDSPRFANHVNGRGDNPREAFEDCLEQMGNIGNIDAATLPDTIDDNWSWLQKECNEIDDMPSVAILYPDSDEMYYYLSIRYNLGK